MAPFLAEPPGATMPTKSAAPVVIPPPPPPRTSAKSSERDRQREERRLAEEERRPPSPLLPQHKTAEKEEEERLVRLAERRAELLRTPESSPPSCPQHSAFDGSPCPSTPEPPTKPPPRIGGPRKRGLRKPAMRHPDVPSARAQRRIGEALNRGPRHPYGSGSWSSKTSTDEAPKPQEQEKHHSRESSEDRRRAHRSPPRSTNKEVGPTSLSSGDSQPLPHPSLQRTEFARHRRSPSPPRRVRSP